MTMPNFLIIGAAKAGTTSLYLYLGQHPQVYMSSIKEPHFFALEGEDLDFRGPGDREALSRMVVINNVEAYRSLFEGVSGEKAVGEASAMYLHSEKAPGRIRYYVPEARLIAILRDPVERAYSSFLHMRRDGREPLSDFAQALEAEEGRIRDGWAPNWHYKRTGYYHEQLSRYFEVFGREQIRVYLYEDLKTDPLGMLRDVYGFLGVDDAFVPDVSMRHNVSGVPKNERLHAFLLRPHPVKTALKSFFPKKLRRRLVPGSLNALRNWNLVKPPFPEEVRRELKETYREDVLRLQDLIGRDLSSWLKQ